jgi:hypothetical protein
MSYHTELADKLRAWISVDTHYNVIHFAVEAGLSKEELFRLAGEDSTLQSALDFAFTVMEWKVSEGALSGTLDRMSALKMLETYSGWKGEVSILQKNEYKQFMNEARVKAEQILSGGTEMDEPACGIDRTMDTSMVEEKV